MNGVGATRGSGRGRTRRGAGAACALLLIGLLGATASPRVAFGESEASEAPAASARLDREARLEQGLADYAAALREADRGERLARFARAERAFASLWTNLGNAALQAGHVGRAVLAYHRALRLDPDANAARQNLAHVRSRLPAWVPRPADTEGLASGLDPRRVPAATRLLGAGLAFAVSALFALLYVRRGEGAWRALAGLAAVVWLLVLASLLVGGGAGQADLAVVTADEVQARSADSSLAPLALPEPLPSGTEVRRLELRGDWARVRLANGRDVWVRASSVTPAAR